MKTFWNDVKEALDKFAIHCPECGHEEASLVVLADDFYDSLRHWDREAFIETCKIHLESNGRFPKINDLYKAYEIVELNRRNRQIMLPAPQFDDRQPDTPEARKNRARIKGLIKKINTEIVWSKKSLQEIANDMERK